jgi:hypothetical protein
LVRTADQVKRTLFISEIETRAQLDAVDGVGVRIGLRLYRSRPDELGAFETSLDLEVK